MKLEAEQVLCRFHLSNLAHHGSEPLYQWIVETARREDLQGATVLKGFMGLQADGTVVREHAWSVSQEVPVIVEVVDGPRHIERLLARVEPAMKEGAITLERAHVTLHRGGEADLKAKDVAPRCDVVATQGSSAALEVKTMNDPRRRRPAAGLHRRERPREGTRPSALRGDRPARARGAPRRRHRPPGAHGLREALADAHGRGSSSCPPTCRS